MDWDGAAAAAAPNPDHPLLAVMPQSVAWIIVSGTGRIAIQDTEVDAHGIPAHRPSNSHVAELPAGSPVGALVA